MSAAKPRHQRRRIKVDERDQLLRMEARRSGRDVSELHKSLRMTGRLELADHAELVLDGPCTYLKTPLGVQS